MALYNTAMQSEAFLLLNLATEPFYCFPTSVHFNRRLLEEGCVRTPTQQRRRSHGELGQSEWIESFSCE